MKRAVILGGGVSGKAAQRLCRALDSLNARMGGGAVFFAAEGIRRAWRPNSSFVSPSYTSDWSFIPSAR